MRIGNVKGLAIVVYTVHIQKFLQEIHQIFGHVRRICTVLANPRHAMSKV